MSTPVLPPFVPGYSVPAPNITPFTYRDGLSYLQRLERIVKYIEITLVPYIEDNYTELAEAFTTEANKLITDVNAALEAQTELVDVKIDALETYVNTSIESIINSTIEVTDPVVHALLIDVDSDSRADVQDLANGIATRNVGISAASYIETHGRTGAAIQAAIDACPEFGTVIVPPGDDWTITQSIIRKRNVSLDLTSANLRVTAAIAGAVIDSASLPGGLAANVDAVKDTQFVITGGTIYCATLAAIGIRARFFTHGIIENTHIESATANYIVSGTNYGSDDTLASYGMYINRVITDRPRPENAPAGSIGFLIYSTDTFVTDCVVVGAETGLDIYGGGSHFKGVQVWARIPQNTTKTAFRVRSSTHSFVDCMADTPSEFGWEIMDSVWSITFAACRHFNNSNAYATDNTAVSVKLVSNNKRITSTGFQVVGSNGHRIKRDFDFGTNTITEGDYYIVGTEIAFTTEYTRLNGGVSIWGSETFDRNTYRNGVNHWTERLENAGGADDLIAVARTDVGGFSHNAYLFDRLNRHAVFALGTAVPTSSKLAVGSYALWVDEASNELKVSWRRRTGDTSIQTDVLATFG